MSGELRIDIPPNSEFFDVLDLIGMHFDAAGTARSYLEIGFGSGDSCAVVLKHRCFARVVVVDVFQPKWGGRFANEVDGVVFVNKFFADREFHDWGVYAGDSKEAIPRVGKTGERFDLILIDGAHDAVTPRVDMQNVRKLLAREGFIVAHDLTHVGREEHIRQIWREWLDSDPDLIGREVGSCTGVANLRHGGG